MITIVKEPYLISRSDVDKEFDGKWVLLYYKDSDPADGYGYLIAYSSGNEQDDNADWNELELLATRNRYGKDAELARGYINRGAEMLHVL